MIYRDLVWVLIVFLMCSCAKGTSSRDQQLNKNFDQESTDDAPRQIADYVVDIYEDSRGVLWFGTLAKGVGRYDGTNFSYLTKDDGLLSNRVTCIIEDKSGNLWFGTGMGISKYDGINFTNYTEQDGLCSNQISNLLIDSKGAFWIGTWAGVCQFDGIDFTPFALPQPDVDVKPNEDTKYWITSISEDSKGNIWFGRDAYGACKYDGEAFEHITRKSGLYSNNVHSVVEDIEGNFWIGTRVAEKDDPDPNKRQGKGGLNKYDGEKVSHFPHIDGANENDVYEIYRDQADDLWFGTIKNGVYRYDGTNFNNYQVTKAIMSILTDSRGITWLGCAGGLYKIDMRGEVHNVSVNGPW